MTSRFEAPLTAWYAASARDLPWRRAGVGSWPILVSEFMLQQTPVSRVLPAYGAWLARWPTAAALASATPADAAFSFATSKTLGQSSATTVACELFLANSIP